jgi:uncharacterized membrane protein YcaP (DUF421 family)
MQNVIVFASVVDLVDSVSRLLGLDLRADELRFSHMALRSVIVFFFSIALVRVGANRLLGKNAAPDIMISILLGSVLSRAVNGQAAFYPTLGASLLLVLLHRLLAWAGVYSHGISVFAKGRDRVLVRDGSVDQRALREVLMTEDDLLENLRLNGGICVASEAKEARLERNGTVSVVRKTD